MNEYSGGNHLVYKSIFLSIRVMGVYLELVEENPGSHLNRENIEDEHVIDEIMSYFKRKVNAVICDLSP